MNTLVSVMMGVSAVAHNSKLSSVRVSISLYIYLVIKALFIISKSNFKAISSSTTDAIINKGMTNGFTHY